MENEDGYKTFVKVTKIINELGARFSTMNGGELSEIQLRLAGYKYFLSDYIAEYQRLAEFYGLEIKNYRASKWDEITETIKAAKGKVSNKEQIENEIIIQTQELQWNKILYENYYNNFRIKLSSIDQVITTVVQRLSILKKDIEINH